MVEGSGAAQRYNRMSWAGLRRGRRSEIGVCGIEGGQDGRFT